MRITGGPAGGTVAAIPSKSAAHRLLIAAALSGQDVEPYCGGLSRDITATKECLTALAKAGADPVSLPCGESGSTLRFLIPVAGVMGTDADMICEGRLPDRPMEPFLQVLAEHGCSVSGRNPKEVRGRLTGGEFCLPGNISSQYVTGLLLALPLAGEDSIITVEGALQSRPYIDLTLEVLARAGIIVEEVRRGNLTPDEEVPADTQASRGTEADASPGIQDFADAQASRGEETDATTAGTSTVFRIPGGQSYRLPPDALEHVEGDWSNAAFWIAMDAMMDGRIDCTGLDPGSSQGDRAIVEIIRRIESADGGQIDIDVSDVPDLVPIVSAFACSREKGAVTNIVNAGRLRFKESDRLKAVTEVLNALGADITELPEGLVIRGCGTLRGGEISSFGDHRIVMMAAAAACIADGEIVIRGAEAVEKSYPGFFEDYQNLGGSWEVIGS